MSGKKFCFCCMLKNVDSNSNYEIAIEEPPPTFDAVKNIWKEKMEKSKLFLPLEIEYILPVWIQFVRSRIQNLPNSDAEEFYVDTAEVAARKLKHFQDHRWECLNMEFPLDNEKCSQDSMHHPQKEKLSEKLHSKDDVDTVSTASTESTSDVLEQVEFLLQLVGSSNFNFSLVKTALDPTFQPTQIEMKSPQVFLLPKKYLELEVKDINAGQIRKDLLNGVYDGYILPLQIANEVNDDFWIRMADEIGAEKKHSYQ